jgi:biopolymer transport protein ExbB
MSNNQKTSGGFSSLMAAIAIVIALVIGVLIYKLVFGNPANFVNGLKDAKANLPYWENEPVEEGVGHIFGLIHKGGFIVPILVAINIIIITFSVERFITLTRAKGKGSIDKFISKIKGLLETKEVATAIEECDAQRGSLANVVRAGLEKYSHVAEDNSMDKEQKIESLKKELEEATALELPMLSKNLVVLSTCASIATLVGLIGTVLGMISSFAAMSSGTPDPAKLSAGISEALINTAFGITGSTIAIVMYNFFSTKVDTMTYSIDEAAFTIVQDFSASNK